MHKNIYCSIIACVVLASVLVLENGCVAGQDHDGNDAQKLNISVFVDLSDRLEREDAKSQMDKDLRIIEYVANFFKNKTMEHRGVQTSKNHMQVFFYPAPNDASMDLLADSLDVDVDKLPKGIERRIFLESLAERYKAWLTPVYETALRDKKYIGCDVWDFFQSGEVDTQCIRKDYRNIIIILTDGYIFHKDNKLVEGTAYSYILPQTLAVTGSSLINHRPANLCNLEVAVLEINPYNVHERDVMMPILKNWFVDMGVEEDKLLLRETNLFNTTKTALDTFLMSEEQ